MSWSYKSTKNISENPFTFRRKPPYNGVGNAPHSDLFANFAVGDQFRRELGGIKARKQFREWNPDIGVEAISSSFELGGLETKWRYSGAHTVCKKPVQNRLRHRIGVGLLLYRT